MEKEILQLSPQAAYNEARKINRFLKEFERFESVLAVLADYDKTAKDLEQQRIKLLAAIEAQRQVLAEVEMQIGVAQGQLAKTVQETENVKERTSLAIVKLEKETHTALDEMKQQAKLEVARLREDLKVFRPQVEALRAEKNVLETEITRLRQQALQQAAAVSEAFKVLG